jgi:hypothetical protein
MNGYGLLVIKLQMLSFTLHLSVHIVSRVLIQYGSKQFPFAVTCLVTTLGIFSPSSFSPPLLNTVPIQMSCSEPTDWPPPVLFAVYSMKNLLSGADPGISTRLSLPDSYVLKYKTHPSAIWQLQNRLIPLLKNNVRALVLCIHFTVTVVSLLLKMVINSRFDRILRVALTLLWGFCTRIVYSPPIVSFQFSTHTVY